jgi:tetratricopeptide (TPR) repeat protein
LDLKNINVRELIDKTVKFVQEKRDTVVSIAIIAVVAIGLAVYFMIHYSNMKQQAWNKMSMAEGYVYNNMPGQAIPVLDEIINSGSGGTSALQYARLLKANALYNTKDYKNSADLYQSIIQQGKPKSMLPFAYAGLGYAKESIGDYPGAISAYKDFSDKYPDHYYAPRVLESTARVYLLSGSLMDAKQMYEKIATLFPGTAWQRNAQLRLSAFAPQQQGQQRVQPTGNPPAQMPITGR